MFSVSRTGGINCAFRSAAQDDGRRFVIASVKLAVDKVVASRYHYGLMAAE